MADPREAGGKSAGAAARRPHPRLLVDDDRVLRSLADQPGFEALRRDAAEILTAPLPTNELAGGLHHLETSRETVRRTYTLALVATATGDRRCVDRLWAELDAAARFPDWNHRRHFLDTAEMTHAFAIAYDWLFDVWSEEQRAVLRDAIVRHGLLPGLAVYRGTADGDGTSQRWHRREHNWNIVCNSGLTLGALAVAESEPELAAEILDRAQRSIRLAVAEYAPGGGYPEGVVYWGYATRYLVLYLAALTTATGDDHGIADSPGLAETALFPLYLTGPSGLTFNHSDSAAGVSRLPEAAWLAERFDLPVARWWAAGDDPVVPRASWASSPIGAVWRPAGPAMSPAAAGLPLDRVYTPGEVMATRSAWDGDAIFLAWKAGRNDSNHGDLDLGSFVLDVGGVRFAEDFGPDDYFLPGYWEFEPGGRRWSYYRKRAEGHNTLVIDPGGRRGGDQVEDAVGTFVEQSLTDTGSWVTGDLSQAHEAIASWRRSAGLLPGRRSAAVHDSIRLSGPADVWWYLHTSADIAVAPDGRSAVLRRDGRALRADLTGSPDPRFLDALARPHWASPDPAEQAPTPDSVRKLAVRLRGVTEATIEVTFTPVEDTGRPPTTARVERLRIDAERTVPTGGSTALGVEAESSDGTTRTIEPSACEYHSSDPSVASVDDRGRVHGVSGGSARITAVLVSAADHRLSFATVPVSVESVVAVPAGPH